MVEVSRQVSLTWTYLWRSTSEMIESSRIIIDRVKELTHIQIPADCGGIEIDNISMSGRIELQIPLCKTLYVLFEQAEYLRLSFGVKVKVSVEPVHQSWSH